MTCATPGLTDDHVKTVCQPGTEHCCRYLTMSAAGWGCEKHSHAGPLIDKRVADGKFKAKGDNCDGLKVNLAESEGVRFLAEA